MKRIICMLLATVVLLSAMPISATDAIPVILNGKTLEFDVPAQIIGNRTMVPMRKIFESLGAKVNWVDEAKLIIASYSTNILAMEIGANSFYITNILTNETKTIELDVPPQIVDGRTLVPVRAISESMGMSVNWVDETRTVYIYNPLSEGNPEMTGKPISVPAVENVQ